MTVPPRPPSWAEIEAFCKIDGWVEVRKTSHRFFRKILDSGGVLETHTSFGRGTMGQARFAFILRAQLQISRKQFWDALESGQPVPRPASEEGAPKTLHPPWVVRVLEQDLHLGEKEIGELTLEEGIRRVQEHWSQQ